MSAVSEWPMTGVEQKAALLVQATGICKRYGSGDNAVQVLNKLDLNLHMGSSLALLGVSGTGKTTLLNILGGIEQADAGELIIDGQSVGTDAAALAQHRRDRVGFIFQFYNLLPSLTVLENVLAGLEAAGSLARDARDRARQALHDVGLGHRADAFPAELSGGQQQRVAIARALAKQAPLVLADEPTGNLDPHTGEQVLDLLIGQCQSAGSALLIVTHNQATAARTDACVSLVDGQLRKAHSL